MKKPPDPDIYKCYKIRLKNITKDSFVIDRIKDAIIRSNHIIIFFLICVIIITYFACN